MHIHIYRRREGEEERDTHTQRERQRIVGRDSRLPIWSHARDPGFRMQLRPLVCPSSSLPAAAAAASDASSPSGRRTGNFYFNTRAQPTAPTTQALLLACSLLYHHALSIVSLPPDLTVYGRCFYDGLPASRLRCLESVLRSAVRLIGHPPRFNKPL